MGCLLSLAFLLLRVPELACPSLGGVPVAARDRARWRL
jgi:hypothetical protein